MIIQESCILSQSDSTLACGWIKKSNFSNRKDSYIQLTTARKIAFIILDSESCYSQWLLGEMNKVSNACSRDFHLSNFKLTHLIISHIPQQVPHGFKMCPLPKEIISWLTSPLQSQPQKQEWNQQPIPSKLSRGLVSSNTSDQSKSIQIPTLTVSLHSKESKYLGLSPTPSEMEDSTRTTSLQKPTLSEPPLIVWHRPTEWPID